MPCDSRVAMIAAARAELLEHVRVMAEAASRVSLAASGQSQAIEGRVCITATEMLATYYLPQVLRKLREQAPDLPCALHFDTGMNRLGLGPEETDALIANPARLDAIDVRQIMSHLACADDARVPGPHGGHPDPRLGRLAGGRLCELCPGHVQLHHAPVGRAGRGGGAVRGEPGIRRRGRERTRLSRTRASEGAAASRLQLCDSLCRLLCSLYHPLLRVDVHAWPPRWPR